MHEAYSIYMPGQEHRDEVIRDWDVQGMYIGVIEADIEEVAIGPGVVVGELHEGRNI